MNESNASQPVEPQLEPQSHSPGARHHGLLIGSAILAGGAIVIAGGYGIYTQAVSLEALALDGALALVLCLLSLSAVRIRRKIDELAESAKTEADAAKTQQQKSQRWGVDTSEETDNLDTAVWKLEHARKQHYLLLAVCPTVAIWLLTVMQLVWSSNAEAMSATPGSVTALGIVCLAASCVWLVLAKSFAAIPEDGLQEAPALGLAFRDFQWASIFVSVAILGSLKWPPLEVWGGRLLSVWVLAVCSEQLVRLLWSWLRPSARAEEFIVPLHVALRESTLVRGNPLSSLLDTIEQRLGVSFRASWAIRFVRLAIAPTIAMVAVLLWGLSSLCVVDTDCMGVRENMGRISGPPLHPGLHWKLPWPLGHVRQFPVKKVLTQPVGHHHEDARIGNILWTNKHADEEFDLLLGNGTEFVAIESVVYYKIREDDEGFLDYVYRSQNPDEALEAYAFRALMEQTRSIAVSDVFSANRAKFAEQLKQSLREYATQNHLGIDVVDVALVALHPPVEAGAAFLDVISARIDAGRAQVEAGGKKLVQIEDSQRESGTAVATAQVEAMKRVGEAVEESAEFVALGSAYAVAPDAFKLRLWFETLEGILKTNRFVLVDSDFAAGPGGILLDQRAKKARRDSTAVMPSVNP